MRTIAFGYSTRCNIKCEHCVAADDHASQTMELEWAKELIIELAEAKVQGISFTAGEPLLYLDDLCALLDLCREYNLYTRVVTNSFWGSSTEKVGVYLAKLKESGVSQLRLSYSRWHQKNVPRQHVVNVAQGCLKMGIDYFISFVTDFSPEDDGYEQYLRDHHLKFFPEPVIFSGRAKSFERTAVHTDYQLNCCPMNPYLAPSGDLFACCDAGSHFTETDFFLLGNVRQTSLSDLFSKSESNRLYNHIRQMGISSLASFAGFKARDIVGYRKCELCEKLFNSPDLLVDLEKEADAGLNTWYR